MTREVNKVQNTWYLNSCTSRYICNNKLFFLNLHPKSYKFVKAGREIIRSYKMDTILLSTCNGTTITVNNITYIPRYNFNLISLGQLREVGIIYHDNSKQMMLKQRGNIIESRNRFKNLFILDTKTNIKMMMTLEKGWPNYLKSQNPQIRLWHCCFEHTSNVRII